jgi:ornithine--oxo-acid transaminase
MNTQEHIELVEARAAHNYHPLPVVVAEAEGVWVTDVEGHRFMDMLAAYSAVNFGHCPAEVLEVAKAQMDRVTLTSRAFHNDQMGPFCEALAKLTGKDMILPMNTGAEAVETALKTARRWGYRVKGVPAEKARIITCEGNFHGRTTTIVSFSTDPDARGDFGPFTPGFDTVPYGDLAALEAAITDETVAFLIEPIQGEGGVLIPPEGFLQQARELCREHDVLFVADEIQAGLGRCGATFCCDTEDVVPDVYILGKALGAGIYPVSAVAANQDVLGVFDPGSHGSTFGGNPLAAAIGRKVCEILEGGSFQENSRELGAVVMERLQALVGPGRKVETVRARPLVRDRRVPGGRDGPGLLLSAPRRGHPRQGHTRPDHPAGAAPLDLPGRGRVGPGANREGARMKVFITGVSSGLGDGLAEAHLQRGDEVWGVSRRAAPRHLAEAGMAHRELDLADFEAVGPALAELFEGVDQLDLVYLNAGLLGRLSDLAESSLEELQKTFDVNVWANKVVLDSLVAVGVDTRQVVAISSGASVSGARGWSGYGVSKAALNMLVRLYAAERPDTHFTALAPGLVETSMQDHICALDEDERFPTVERLRAARGTTSMPQPLQAAEAIMGRLPLLRRRPSGEYVDLRHLPEPGVAPLADLPASLPKHIRQVVERRTPIPSIAGRAKAMQAENPNLVRADIGQISGLDPELEELYGPPVGLQELRSMVAEAHNLTHDLEGDAALGPENVCITTGAAEGLALLFQAFAENKVVGLPRGHWSNYRNGVEVAGGQCVVVDYFDGGGDLDLDGLADAVRRENIEVLVANFPCNPTGAVLSRAEGEALAGAMQDMGVLCIADEVYEELRYDDHPPVSLLNYAPEHVVRVSSASKQYLLPGARVGYVSSRSADLTDKVLRKLVRANTASPNVLGQRRLMELLGPDLEDRRAGKAPQLLTRVRDAMKARRDSLLEVLDEFEMPCMGRPGHRPEGTIFLMAGVPSWFDGDDAGFADAALDAGAVSVVPGSAFGIPSSVRFSYGGMTVEQIAQLRENLAALRG